MKKLALAAAATIAAVPAAAQDVQLKPLIEARLRHEHVDQDGLALRSDAVTARVRAGVQATSGSIVATVQAQGNVAIGDRYFDGLNAQTNRPLIADPENVAIYLANLQFRSKPWTLTAGRQKIMLDDERFVGNAAIRQNAQTYDGVRSELTPVKGLKLDVSYVWAVQTIWGIEGRGARQRAVSGDNLFANLSYTSPVGTLTGFAYRVDQNEAAVQGYRLSSQTYGARLAGTRPLSTSAKLGYQFSYATQSDAGRNPNDYRADYYLADLTLDFGAWKLNGGSEVLGADRGVALTSFQTPLGSVFKFQGWADKLTTTPPNGLRDRYVGVMHGWKRVGPAANLALSAYYHWYHSDRLSLDYGEELNLLASGKLGRTTASVRYAHYDAKAFATDTDKLWLQLDWSL